MTLTEIGQRALLAGYSPLSNPAGMAMEHPNGLRVIVSIGQESDGKNWVHVSLSRASYLPSWEDIKFVRDTIVGRDAKVVQVLPPGSEHVNIHPFCHHFFHCIDGDPLPDFTQGRGGL